MIDHPLHNWIPYKLSHNDGAVQCHWLNTLSKPFTEPFFDETIAICKGFYRYGIYRGSVSDLDLLIEWGSAFTEITPSAFIFHISRCGSTLVSQLLGMSEEYISLAEVPIFDDILRLPYKTNKYSEEQIRDLFTASLKFYGQPRTGKEKRLFIKTDSWHILFCSRLRTIYVNVPFILLYRKPDEVLYSHVKLRGIQAVPGLIEPEIFGFKQEDLTDLSLDEYTARVLERYYEIYDQISGSDDLSLLVSYHDGVLPVMEQIACFCNFAFSKTDLLKMQERTGYHSKHPDRIFKKEQSVIAPAFLNGAFELYNIVKSKRLLHTSAQRR